MTMGHPRHFPNQMEVHTGINQRRYKSDYLLAEPGCLSREIRVWPFKQTLNSIIQAVLDLPAQALFLAASNVLSPHLTPILNLWLDEPHVGRTAFKFIPIEHTYRQRETNPQRHAHLAGNDKLSKTTCLIG